MHTLYDDRPSACLDQAVTIRWLTPHIERLAGWKSRHLPSLDRGVNSAQTGLTQMMLMERLQTHPLTRRAVEPSGARAMVLGLLVAVGGWLASGDRAVAQSPNTPPSSSCVNAQGRPIVNGRGVCTFPGTGNRYEGEFRNGRREGQGTFIYADGTRCQGQFKNQLLNGPGVCTFPDGTRYEGEFRDHELVGQGAWVYPDGSRCSGTFVNQQLVGQVVCTFPSGNRYEGEFRNGQRQGQGTFIYANGTRCEGQFENQQLSGPGVCIFPDGSRFSGRFTDGVRSGRGTYTNASGQQAMGRLSNGRFIPDPPPTPPKPSSRPSPRSGN